MHKTILLVTLATILGHSSLMAQKQENHNSQVARNIEVMNNIYREIDMFYVDSIDADTLMLWGINSMLNMVDPYTTYYPAEDDDLVAMAEGKYAGIGSIIRFHKKHDRVVISEPQKGFPADLAGLKAGDIIISIDDKDVKGWPVAKVSQALRGEAGTTFSIKVQRPGESTTRTMTITRQTISLPRIPYYGCIRDGIGYLILTGFNDGDAKHARAALMEMKEQGAKKLVLDLRDNPGGSLSESVDIANLFLPKGTKIVYTKGKTGQADKEYYTRMEPVDTVMPVVVLVNGGSASAAEILSGALQDMDRAVVMGTRTYGKGLVQTIHDLSSGGSLKLTISRYYIPSGRCIQSRDYRHLNEDGSAKTLPDSLTSLFHTRAGRSVRDGGGINPDVIMIPDTMSTIAFDLSESDVLFDYVTQYAQSHPTIASPSEFSITDEEYEDFVKYVTESDFKCNKRSQEMLNLLSEVIRREGYLEETQSEIDTLRKKLQGDLSTDMHKFKDGITEALEQAIVSRYYYAQGEISYLLRRDKILDAACKLLDNEKEYEKKLK